MTDGLILIKPKKDLTGEVFGKLVVLRQGPDLVLGGKRRASWYCKCLCGNPNELLISGDSLKTGHTKSCGCIHKDTYKDNNVYDLDGEYGKCIINNDAEFIFDLEDYDKIKKYTWHLSTNGYVITTIYKRKTKEHKGMMLHRYLMNVQDIPWNKCVIDHINGNIKDNRKLNLRVVTQSENGMNSKLSKNNTSGVVGVVQQNNKWAAYIRYKTEQIYLGIFDTFEEAVKTRKEAEEKYFGEYSYDNSRKRSDDIYD